jgi:hypothetical protein
MKKTFLIFTLLIHFLSFGQNEEELKTIHVFVALCDNLNQGIVPVPELLGNGQDAKNNLYWGALYGVKSFLRNKSRVWIYQSSVESKDKDVLESILFKHKTKNIYLLAEAYDGKKIQKCTEAFLLASNSNLTREITATNQPLKFGGASKLVVYIGHDGLMEFKVDLKYKENPSNTVDAMILACLSQNYFRSEIAQSKANPILWTTNLMAPEAYTLEAALNAWCNNQSAAQIKEEAAKAYNKYQKCGINGARNLFATGL